MYEGDEVYKLIFYRKHNRCESFRSELIKIKIININNKNFCARGWPSVFLNYCIYN